MNVSQTAMDKAAIGLSLICTVHCLLLPIALTMLPALGASIAGDENFHLLLLLAVIPTSLIALTLGCRKHGHGHVVLTGLLGLIILTLTAFLGHDLLGDSGEKVASVLGAGTIALTHIRNYRLCRDAQCHCRSD